MFTMQCDQCNKLADPIKEKPLKLPPGWIAIFFTGEEYHFCSTKCAIAFLSSMVLSDEP